MTRLCSLKASMAVTLVTVWLIGCSTVPQKTPEQARTDEATADRIYSALNADPTFYFRHVDVRVDGGVAYLSGFIWSTEALFRAKEIAAAVPGVSHVVNELELEREGRRGGGHSGTG